MKKNHCCYGDLSIGLVTEAEAKQDKQVKNHVKTSYVMTQIHLQDVLSMCEFVWLQLLPKVN
jgi:hypothetical protein